MASQWHKCGTGAASLAVLGVLLAVSALAPSVGADESAGGQYSVGVGIADTTGPAADIGMMGYGKASQTTAGIHMRTYARAFIIESGGARVAYVNLDAGMAFSAVRINVLKRLAADKNIPAGMYTADNLAISATHTHSTPAGYSYYALYSVTSKGFVKETFAALVEGVTKAILRAHANMVQGASIKYATGKLHDSNINRSPSSYLLNPQAERDAYLDGNTDKDMVLLRFDDAAGRPIGMLNWFSVHGSSMKNTNQLISSDNKGYAQYLIEKRFNGQGALPGHGPFVAAFGQTNEGDSTPNTQGDFCPDGSRCAEDSTCNGKQSLCKSRGPGVDMFDSCRIIGEKQASKALELFDGGSAMTSLSGPVGHVSTNVLFENYRVSPAFSPSKKEEKLCVAAAGYSFAAGCSDGEALDMFKQGEKTTDPFIKFVTNLLSAPTEEQKKCHGAKAILLNLGAMKSHTGLNWVPHVLPFQILRVGQLVIIVAPMEITTMAGRRLRKSVQSALAAAGMADAKVVISGLANAYAGYCTTPEEYANQRYEGGSTMWGPNQLPALQQIYSGLATNLAKGTKPDAGPALEDYIDSVITEFVLPVVWDTGNFGNVLAQPNREYTPGEIVTATFESSNPRNDRMTESTFLEVQLKNGQAWTSVYTDADWNTKFTWQRKGVAGSHAIIEWAIPADVTPGTYRILHRGVKKTPVTGTLSKFEGITQEFSVKARNPIEGGTTSSVVAFAEDVWDEVTDVLRGTHH